MRKITKKAAAAKAVAKPAPRKTVRKVAKAAKAKAKAATAR